MGRHAIAVIAIDRCHPGSRQTPDFGTFAFDDRGEMVIPLVTGPWPAATEVRPKEEHS